MTLKPIAIIFIGLLAMVDVAEAAGDAAAGKVKGALCFACHGEKGEGVAPNPALTGKSEADLVKALTDFKSGAKVHPVMNAIAGTLSDQDIENLAAYYASFK